MKTCKFLLVRASLLARRWGQFWSKVLAGQAGFTMVEIVVSITVLSTTSVALAGAMSTGYLSYRVAERDMTVLTMATDQLEQTKAYSPYILPGLGSYPTITPPTGYGITVVAATVAGRDSSTLEKITVAVTYNDITKLVIEDYKANR